ncbi:MAG: tetratricopeptide repeat protein [Sedimentisphaerales bacterium]|nr:tetratricopeptide repeat protein [Sedimentisphaerales bacterium]
MNPLPKKWHVVIICLLLAIAILVAYEGVRHNDFVYDDWSYVTLNHHIQSGITPATIRWAFTKFHSANWHPLTWLSHALDVEIFGLDPAGHHVTNVIIHLVNSLLLFWILQQMTGKLWASTLVAAAFALHPVHVESVAWVSERKDVLSAFFAFLTIGAYVRYAARPGIGRYLWVFLFLAFGLMSKPMLVTLPFILGLLDYWPLNRIRGWSDKENITGYPQFSPSTLLMEKTPLFILVMVSCIITFIAQRGAGATAGVNLFSIKMRLCNMLISYVSYLGKMIYPRNLCVFYPWRGNSIPDYLYLLSFLFLSATTVLVIWLSRRKRYLMVGWFWFLGMLVPVIGLVQIGGQSMADRYTYLPGIGFFIMVSWGLSDLVSRWLPDKRALGIFTLILIAAMIAGTRRQTRYWENNITLFAHTLGVKDCCRNTRSAEDYARYLENQFHDIDENTIRPIEIDLRFVYAWFYLGEYYLELNNIEHAYLCYNKSCEQMPEYYTHFDKPAQKAKEQGQMDLAVRIWEKVIKYNPGHINANYNLGMAAVRQGHYDKAREYFNQVLKKNPNHYLAANNLAFALEKTGKIDEAIDLWKRVLTIVPNYPNANFSLGTAMYLQGRFDEALEYFHTALQSNPDWFEIQVRLGDIYYQTNDFKTAIDHWTHAVRLEPESPEVLNKLAWTLATAADETLRNPADAVRYAQKACELTQSVDYAKLDTLSAAYAAAGEYDKAVETAEKSIRIATDAGDQTYVQDAQNRLKLYQAHQPYYLSP